MDDQPDAVTATAQSLLALWWALTQQKLTQAGAEDQPVRALSGCFELGEGVLDRQRCDPGEWHRVAAKRASQCWRLKLIDRCHLGFGSALLLRAQCSAQATSVYVGTTGIPETAALRSLIATSFLRVETMSGVRRRLYYSLVMYVNRHGGGGSCGGVVRAWPAATAEARGA